MADYVSSRSDDRIEGAANYRTVALRHPTRRIVESIILLLAVVLGWKVISNSALNWPMVAHYLFDAQLMRGIVVTVELTILAMLVALVLGLILAVMRMSVSPVLSKVAGLYIWAFRGTPALVQLIAWYNMATIFPNVALGIPFTHIGWSADMNSIMTPLVAATLGLGLNEAAYMAEIIRAGIQSVEPGQMEAASALGMTPVRTLRRVVLPQAMRVILPPTGNETIGMLKYTSLASVVSLQELLGAARGIYAQNFQVIPLLIVVSIWYLFATSLLTVGQVMLERRFGRGAGPAGLSPAGEDGGGALAVMRSIIGFPARGQVRR